MLLQGFLQRNLTELILLATQTKLTPETYSDNRFLSSSIYQIKVPETVDVIEAVTESPSSYRKSDKLIVSDGRNLVFIAPNEQHYFVEFSNRTLSSAEIEDKKIIRRLIEKAIDIKIQKANWQRNVTGNLFARRTTQVVSMREG